MGKGASGASAEPQEQRSWAQHVYLSHTHTHTHPGAEGRGLAGVAPDEGVVPQGFTCPRVPRSLEFHVLQTAGGGAGRGAGRLQEGGLPQSSRGKAEQRELERQGGAGGSQVTLEEEGRRSEGETRPQPDPGSQSCPGELAELLRAEGRRSRRGTRDPAGQ